VGDELAPEVPLFCTTCFMLYHASDSAVERFSMWIGQWTEPRIWHAVRTVALALLLVPGVGCGSRAAAAKKPASAASASSPALTAPDRLPDAGWSRFGVPHLAMSLVLPDRTHWKQEEGRGSSVLLVHGTTGTRLTLRIDPTSRRARWQDCLGQLSNTHRNVLQPEDANLLGPRPWQAPAGFTGEIWGWVGPGAERGLLSARFVAVAVDVDRCLFLVGETAARGSNASDELARRMALLVDGVASRLELLTADSRGEVGRSPIPAVPDGPSKAVDR